MREKPQRQGVAASVAALLTSPPSTPLCLLHIESSPMLVIYFPVFRSLRDDAAITGALLLLAVFLHAEPYLLQGGDGAEVSTSLFVSSSTVASVQRFEHPSERSLLRHSAEQYGVSHRRHVTLSSGGRGQRQNAQWGGVATKSISIDVLRLRLTAMSLRLRTYDVAASASSMEMSLRSVCTPGMVSTCWREIYGVRVNARRCNGARRCATCSRGVGDHATKQVFKFTFRQARDKLVHVATV